MTERPLNVLFLCTGNSARSVIAEAILNRIGKRFHAYSAGSQPKGQVNPNTIALLQSLGYDTADYRSKSWDEFAKPGAPRFDFIFTVCDSAAAEACPFWPGHPMTIHWGVPDPAEAKGTPSEITAAFQDAHRLLKARIEALVALPFDDLEQATLKSRLREIGRMEGATVQAAAAT